MGKSSKPTIGFWYRVGYHHGLTIGPIDAFLEMRGGDKTAWQGQLTASGTISINAPNLWGGEKDQGGIVGDLDVMFGEPTQVANPYLVATFGDQTPAWRGFATVVFKGGRYGAMNPYPQQASYKFRQILQGWDGECWYPEKAVIQLTAGVETETTISHTDYWKYRVEASGSTADYSDPAYDDSSWSIGLGGFGNRTDQIVGTSIDSGEAGKSIWLRRQIDGAGVTSIDLFIYADDGAWLWWNGVPKVVASSPGIAITIPAEDILDSNTVVLQVVDSVPFGSPAAIYAGLDVTLHGSIGGLKAINPAHVLYYSRTNGDMGREPTANINEASLQAAADKLYAEGFGICPKWDPASESVEDFEQRISKLIGGSFTRSMEDGQWYLDLARGDYVLDDLPILTDDDILDFKEQPATLDNAINSVSVRYFDPEKKETIVTPPVRALGLVAAFGTIHQTNDYPEVPTAELAARLAQRDLLTTATPTRTFDQATTRRTYSWRPNQYFRLQSLKRGIADMVCIVGDKQSGTLKSGGIKIKAAQDIYSLPLTSFVQVEPGVDTRPPQTPTPITLQRAIEAPYIEVAAAMSRADLAALPTDVGFAMAVAAAPAGELDFSMMVAPDGGSYEEVSRGEWCATATVVESTISPLDTDFTLAGGVHLDQVTVGMGVLWDGELARVDAIDAEAGTISLGRGCADTVPSGAHAAGSRLWFYETGFAADLTEYTDGETVDVRLLSNTGSQQLPLASATPMAITFDQRQARPYPPGQFKINAANYPTSITGGITVSWAHRDRLLQADQLVDTTAATIGPEAGTTYTIRYYLDDVLVHTESSIAGTSGTPYTIDGDGVATIELFSVRDSLESFQMHSWSFEYFGAPRANRITTTGARRITSTGGIRQVRG